jgi:acetyltransferase-like isoleucine patch superfamily enzyme
MGKGKSLLYILIDLRFYVFLIRRMLGWMRGLIAEFAATRQGRIIVGRRAYVHPSVLFQVGAGQSIEIGDHTSVNAFTVLIGNVRIERYCLVSVNVYVSSGDHYARLFPHWLIRNQDDWASQQAEQKTDLEGPVHIEEDVWIGWGVFIKRGIYIGRGAIIGAGTIVTRDVPPYSIQVGTPNREIDRRLVFDPPTHIKAVNDAHLPYFYAGLLVRTEQLIDARARGILWASDCVRVVLRGGAFGAVRLTGLLQQGTGCLELRMSCNGVVLGQLSITQQRFECEVQMPCDARSECEVLPAILAGYNQIELQVMGRRSSSHARSECRYGISAVSLVPRQ